MAADRFDSDRIYVDIRDAGEHKRYGINHGIARYAREIVPRLTVDWEPFQGWFRRATPPDVISPHRMALPRQAVLYCPGFSAGVARCTQLLTLHDLTHLQAPTSRLTWLRGYYEGVVRPVLKKAGHVLTNSGTSAEGIRAWLDDDRVTVHNTGIGCSSEFTPDGPAATMDRPYFIYVGNVKAHKNIRPMFEAMAQFPDHLLVTVLAAADVPTATALAGGFDIADRLVVKTAVSDAELAALYRGSDALVFPSRWEGVGLPVIEALMTGTKVIYSRAAEAVGEICADSQFAVDDADDARQFADRMAVSLDAPFRAPSGLAQYHWDTVASRIDAVIKLVRAEAKGASVRS